MPDPLDDVPDLPDLPDLSGLRGVDVQPPPAAEVRARGDRLRRRRTALTVLGAAAAVAVVTAGVSLVGGGAADRSDPGPADSSSPHTPGSTEAPDPAPEGSLAAEFPLAVGLPDTNDDGSPVEVRVGVQDDIVVCGAALWTGTEAMDVATTSYVAPEDFRGRTLLLYPAIDDAAAAIDQARSTLAGCAEVAVGGTDQVYTPVADDPMGEDSVMFSQRYRSGDSFDTGLTMYRLVRVGSALLLTVDYAEANGSPQSASDFYATTRDSTQEVVDEMGIFSGSAPVDPAAVGADDLLLPADVPSRERLGPWQVSGPTGTVLACQEAGLEQLGAPSTAENAFEATIAGYPDEDPASVVRTAVLGFADDAAAATAYDTVTAWVRDCPDGKKVPGRTDADIEGGRGSWWVRTFAAPEVCTDCDAARFNRMGVAQIGDRLVLVSLAEVGGPLEPEGLDETMTALFDAAVTRARP